HRRPGRTGRAPTRRPASTDNLSASGHDHAREAGHLFWSQAEGTSGLRDINLYRAVGELRRQTLRYRLGLQLLNIRVRHVEGLDLSTRSIRVCQSLLVKGFSPSLIAEVQEQGVIPR